MRLSKDFAVVMACVALASIITAYAAAASIDALRYDPSFHLVPVSDQVGE